MKGKANILLTLGGAAAGIINGLLGTGGGMIAVPILKNSGLEQKQAQAASVLMIMLLSLETAAIYLWRGRITLSTALPYLPGGIIGALIGAALLKKIPDKILRRIFGGLMIYTGLRLLMR